MKITKLKEDITGRTNDAFFVVVIVVVVTQVFTVF